MEAQFVTNRSTDTLLLLFDLHSTLFVNVIEGISDKDAHDRLNTRANHIAWLAGSLVHERFELSSATGAGLKYSLQKFFEDHKGIQDDLTYPTLGEYKIEWEKITPVLRETLVRLSEEQLESPDPYGMPGYHLTLFEAMTFIIDRESYCIGQIGLWRRLLGYEAMKYK